MHFDALMPFSYIIVSLFVQDFLGIQREIGQGRLVTIIICVQLFNVSLEPYNDTEGSRFYRFVQSLHFDYRLFRSNKPM